MSSHREPGPPRDELLCAAEMDITASGPAYLHDNLNGSDNTRDMASLYDTCDNEDRCRRKKGPPKDMKRVCRDTPCLLLFIANLGVLLWILFYAMVLGDLDRLTSAIDSKGWMCGMNNKDGPDNTNKKKLYIFDIGSCNPTGDCLSPSVCVEECPETTRITLDGLAADAKFSSDGDVPCVVGTDYDMTARDNVFNFDCAAYTIDSTPFLGRCIPIPSQAIEFLDPTTNPYSNGNTTITTDTIRTYDGVMLTVIAAQRAIYSAFRDAVLGWYVIVGAWAIGLGLIFIYLASLRILAPCIIYTSFIGAVGMCAVIGIYAWIEYDRFVRRVHPGYEIAVSFSDLLPSQYELNSETSSWFNVNTQKYMCLVVAVIFSLITFLVLCLVCALRKSIRTGVAVIRETSRAAAHVWGVFIYPIFPTVGIVGITALFLFICVMIYTSAEAQYYLRVPDTSTYVKCDDCTQKTPNVLVAFTGEHTNHWYLYMYLIFGFLWIFNFILDWASVTIAGSFATYYWSVDGEMYRLPTWRAHKRTFLYHMGSVAFGSLILTTVQWCRIMLTIVEKQLTKERTGITEKITKFLLKCLHCCLWCLEKIIKFMNRNAYVEMAVYGFGFCKSARRAFWLLLRNFTSVAFLTGMSGFVLFLGKLLISSSCGLVAYIYIYMSIQIAADELARADTNATTTRGNPYPAGVDKLFAARTIDNWYIPVLLVFISVWVTASGFFHIYRMGTSTIFLCYCEDIERHDGSPENPYYARKELLKTVETARQRKQRQEEKKADFYERKAKALRERGG